MEPWVARFHCIDGRECNEEIGSPPHKTNHRRRKEEARKGTVAGARTKQESRSMIVRFSHRISKI